MAARPVGVVEVGVLDIDDEGRACVSSFCVRTRVQRVLDCLRDISGVGAGLDLYRDGRVLSVMRQESGEFYVTLWHAGWLEGGLVEPSVAADLVRRFASGRNVRLVRRRGVRFGGREYRPGWIVQGAKMWMSYGLSRSPPHLPNAHRARGEHGL
jgi:hypothetical protein